MRLFAIKLLKLKV